MFEDKELADKAVVAVEKQIHHEDMDEAAKRQAAHIEEKPVGAEKMA